MLKPRADLDELLEKMGRRKEGVRLAIEKAGGARALARKLGISAPAILAWQQIPAHRIIQIETVLGIPRERLRPDLY
jgi:DNA-binding transcriptional regulator YdaS (Cro superfamily)